MSAFKAPRWPRAALSGMAAAALLTAALPTAAPARAADRTGPPVPARYAHQQLNWQPCEAKPSLECARMTVPRDWHHPDTGPDLTVAVSRHRASDPARRRGVLMMAAGGPGASGLTRPADFAARSPAVGAAYDVVGFDQRGSAAAHPPGVRPTPSSRTSTPMTSATVRPRPCAATSTAPGGSSPAVCGAAAIWCPG
ncbi:hypothetical protein [Streptomyces sp. bgisy130]|uniref:hypothetical protein n=1 Tax=Streptomyces sp. bgisy130 TaxID=3413788 RepID=UPI003F4A136B